MIRGILHSYKYNQLADFLEETYKIVEILNRKNQEQVAKKFPKALSMGGTLGERFSIVICLLKTYEISNPDLFNLIEDLRINYMKLPIA